MKRPDTGKPRFGPGGAGISSKVDVAVPMR
jgi:hypothetical protein